LLSLIVSGDALCRYCSDVIHAFSSSHPIGQHGSTPLIEPYSKPVQETRDNPIKVPSTTQAEIDAWLKKHLTYDHWYQTQDGTASLLSATPRLDGRASGQQRHFQGDKVSLLNNENIHHPIDVGGRRLGS
jgi:hypothetical protein